MITEQEIVEILLRLDENLREAVRILQRLEDAVEEELGHETQ